MIVMSTSAVHGPTEYCFFFFFFSIYQVVHSTLLTGSASKPVELFKVPFQLCTLESRYMSLMRALSSFYILHHRNIIFSNKI